MCRKIVTNGIHTLRIHINLGDTHLMGFVNSSNIGSVLFQKKKYKQQKQLFPGRETVLTSAGEEVVPILPNSGQKTKWSQNCAGYEGLPAHYSRRFLTYHWQIH